MDKKIIPIILLGGGVLAFFLLRKEKEKIPQDYVSYWKFEEDANDETGRNDGILVGNALIDYYGGTTKPVLVLDGMSGVDCGNDPSLNPENALTVSFWCQTSLSDWQWAFAKEDEVNILGYGLYLRLSLGELNTHPYMKINNEWKDLTSDTLIELDTWVHYAMVWDGIELSLYKNGFFDGSMPAEGIFNPSNTNFLIGKEPRELYDRDWMGAIGDFIVYGRALANDEIIKIYELQKEKYVL